MLVYSYMCVCVCTCVSKCESVHNSECVCVCVCLYFFALIFTTPVRVTDFVLCLRLVYTLTHSDIFQCMWPISLSLWCE